MGSGFLAGCEFWVIAAESLLRALRLATGPCPGVSGGRGFCVIGSRISPEGWVSNFAGVFKLKGAGGGRYETRLLGAINLTVLRFSEHRLYFPTRQLLADGSV